MNQFLLFQKLMRTMANHVSSNPAYCKESPIFKQLMAMKDAIPFACLFLEESPHEAFAMLYDLVPPEKQPPNLPDYYRGRIPMYQEMWKYWALHEGYLKTCYNARGYWVEDK